MEALTEVLPFFPPPNLGGYDWANSHQLVAYLGFFLSLWLVSKLALIAYVTPSQEQETRKKLFLAAAETLMWSFAFLGTGWWALLAALGWVITSLVNVSLKWLTKQMKQYTQTPA